MKLSTRQRICDWIIAFAIILAWTALLGYMQGKDEAAMYEEGYKAGAKDTAQLAKDTLKSDQTEIALKWWVGSDDMNSVRERLCSNYNKPKVKK